MRSACTAVTAAIRLEVVRHFENLPIDRRAWNALAARSETSTVFQTYEWFSSWCHVFGGQNELWLVLAYEGEMLAGIVPLACRKRKMRFAAERHADYCDVIAAERKRDVIRAVLALLVEHQGAWDSIALHNIPARSSTVALLQELAAPCGLRLLVRGTVICPAIVFEDVPGGASTLLNKESLQRPFRWFSRNGQMSFRNIDNDTEAQRLLTTFFSQHIERWRNAKHPSLFLDPDNKRFYQQLVREMLPSGWLVFSMIEHNGKALAFHIGFTYADTFLWYKPSFDIGLKKHSPGNVLLRFLLQYSIAHNNKQFDFTVGDEPFKQRYANTTPYNTNVLLAAKMRPYVAARLWLAFKRSMRFLTGGRI